MSTTGTHHEHTARQVRQYFLDESFYAADVSVRGLCDDDESIFACEAFSPSAATVKVGRQIDSIRADSYMTGICLVLLFLPG